MATFDDVGARIICGGLHPDHSTVAGFVRRNTAAVLALLPESVKACAAEGLVSLEVVAGDGTKLKANAAMASNVTAAQLDAQIAELEALIEAELRQWVQDMLGEDPPGGPRPGGPGPGPGDGAGGEQGKAGKKSKPARPGQVLARRQAARAQLAARQQDKRREELLPRIAELAARAQRQEAAAARREQQVQARRDARAARAAAGEKISGRAPIASAGQDRDLRALRAALARTRADHQAALAAAAGEAGKPGEPGAKVNIADPSSRVMPLKKGGFDQLHNVQALATARTQVILAVTRHDNPADVRALEALLAAARRVLDQAAIPDEIQKALFDAGYASDANFTLDIPETLYIAVTREARQSGRSADGRAPAAMLPSWQEMDARLATEEGRKLYRQRAATIEPVFAQLTARLGRTLNYRGDHADAELALWAASHNLLKAITARGRRLARQARTATTAPAPATA
jgi:hypothetical protein